MSTKVSIITVCYNAAATLANTIESIINQTYDNIEYIIIDGGSTDGTLQIIKSYSDKIAYWKSESDKGIYDAMNKGLKYATGEWIGFMNSGDKYASAEIIESVFHNIDYSDTNVIYGQTIMYLKWGVYKVKPDNPVKLDSILCHQSVFVRTAIHKKYPFNLQLKYVADDEVLKRIMKEYPNSFSYFPSVIAVYDGVVGFSSDANKTEAERDTLKGTHSHIICIKRQLINLLPETIKFLLMRIYYAMNPRYEKIENQNIP